jgi:hypothetical protein
MNGFSIYMSNFTYITKGRARNPIPEYTKQELANPKRADLQSDFDVGHDGMTAEDFKNLNESKTSGLDLHRG